MVFNLKPKQKTRTKKTVQPLLIYS